MSEIIKELVNHFIKCKGKKLSQRPQISCLRIFISFFGADNVYYFAKAMLYSQKNHYFASEYNKGHERMEDLEEHLGYWTPVVIAAAFVARELHKGQKDKGGNDYFTSHLLAVGSRGYNWKEKTVGFLHDAAEDTPYSVDEVVEAVRTKLNAMANSKPEDWMDEFDIMPYPNGTILFPSDEDWKEIKAALHTLNHHNADNRTAYIQKIKQNKLALKVKLNDLRNNMDLSRIPRPTDKDLARLERYKAEYAELMERFNELFRTFQKKRANRLKRKG